MLELEEKTEQTKGIIKIVFAGLMLASLVLSWYIFRRHSSSDDKR